MKKLIKTSIFLIAIIVGYIFLIIFLGNPGKEIIEKTDEQDIQLRANFITARLVGDLSEIRQFKGLKNDRQAGEWTLGSYAMATYALTNIAMEQPARAQQYSELIAQWINTCQLEEVKAFDISAWLEDPLAAEVLNGDQGHIGYYGHLNLMMGAYALLNDDGQFKELHQKISQAIVRRMNKYHHRHVETYPYEVYPVDNTVAVASLRIADMTLSDEFGVIIEEWIEQTRKIEDKETGLIPTALDENTGVADQMIRGSYHGWNSFFLPLIDENYAREQFERFRSQMLITVPGFAFFKEHLPGQLFTMDMDSGPVLFNIGASATGFSVAGARWAQDEKLLSGLLRSLELFGISVDKGDERHYLTLPVIADSIMLAMKTATDWRILW